ncbi:MAG: family transcriptional regulator [Subtercola sp.]|nr:family transcriptional regulator [Subtercola sp.]
MSVSATTPPGAGDHLEFIRRAGHTTRRAIAEHTGLSRSVVAQTVSELIAQGLVIEHRLSTAAVTAAASAGRARAARGRPTAVLQLARQHGVVVACDIGHRHVTVAIADLHGHLIAEQSIDFPVDEGSAQTFSATHALVFRLLDEARSTVADVCGFGVSLPFPITTGRASVPIPTVRAPSNLDGWHSTNLTDATPAGLSCPVVIDNDANFGAWGERMVGNSAAIDNLLYVKLSDGIGAGLIVNGTLLAGATGLGGEMGHIEVQAGGALCRCGRRGCLEAVVADCLPDYHRAGLRVGRAVAQLCAFVDPEVVVLGGRVGSMGEPLLAGVRQALADYSLDGTVSVVVRSAAWGARSELMGIIDRTLAAAWASDRIAGRRSPREASAAYDRRSA